MKTLNNEHFHIDFAFAQKAKHGENTCGDTVLYRKVDNGNRLICVLSDGLGSGIKANILSSMTASMALRFMEDNRSIAEFADIMISTLPVCTERKLSYATFSIIDITQSGRVTIAEMGNPNFILIKDSKLIKIKPKVFKTKKWQLRNINFYDFDVNLNHRLIMISDGISQAGPNAYFNYKETVRNILSKDKSLN